MSSRWIVQSLSPKCVYSEADGGPVSARLFGRDAVVAVVDRIYGKPSLRACCCPCYLLRFYTVNAADSYRRLHLCMHCNLKYELRLNSSTDNPPPILKTQNTKKYSFPFQHFKSRPSIFNILLQYNKAQCYMLARNLCRNPIRIRVCASGKKTSIMAEAFI